MLKARRRGRNLKVPISPTARVFAPLIYPQKSQQFRTQKKPLQTQTRNANNHEHMPDETVVDKLSPTSSSAESVWGSFAESRNLCRAASFLAVKRLVFGFPANREGIPRTPIGRLFKTLLGWSARLVARICSRSIQDDLWRNRFDAKRRANWIKQKRTGICRGFLLELPLFEHCIRPYI